MKIQKKDLRSGIVSVLVTHLQDLWYLSHIIQKDDLVTGKASRKTDVTEKDKVKRVFTVQIRAESLDYQETTLRVNGIITEAPDDIEKGVFQNISLEDGSFVTIKKVHWSVPDLKRLEDATKEDTNTIIVSLDRDRACFAALKKRGYSILTELKGDVQKKGYQTDAKDFFGEIINHLEQYNLKYAPSKIIVASPSFWKQTLTKYLSKELTEKVIYANTSSGDESGIKEVLQQESVSKALKEDNITKQIQFVEEFLTQIKTQGKAAYGWKETLAAIDAGAVEVLLITDRFLKDAQESGIFSRVDKAMESVEKSRGAIYIIEELNQAGKLLQGFGGIGAILRYKLVQ